MTAYHICALCDGRFGNTGTAFIEISLCPPCVKKYRERAENDAKAAKYDTRAERDAIVSVWRRMKNRSDVRIGRRLKVF